MSMFNTTKKFLQERQTRPVRILHVAIIALISSQLIVSNFMAFSDTGDISSNTIEFYGTWLHIITGLILIPVAITFLFVELRRHSLKYFFPYLYGEFTQLSSDIKHLFKLKLPEESDYGITGSIQGLGLGALLLVLLTGLLWFITWNANLSWSDDIEDLHKLLTGLVQAYMIGHGVMGVLHIFVYSKSLNRI